MSLSIKTIQLKSESSKEDTKLYIQIQDRKMTNSEIIMTFAVLLAPIIAVQVSQYIDRKRQTKQEKMKLFKTLMSTRATNMEKAHVEALNMIDVAFYSSNKKDNAVVSQWKIYLDHLNDGIYPRTSWDSKRKEIFVDLMFIMADSLGFEFDKSHINKTSYYPSGHGEIAGDQFQIRKGLLSLIKGDIALTVEIKSPVDESDTA